MAKTVLVTGASGYIGRHVAEELCRRGCKVYAVDVVNRGLPADLEFLPGNILSDDTFVDALPDVDVVLHLAWMDGFKHNAPSHLSNLSAHYNFVRRLAEKGCRHIAVMGTMHEVGYHEGAINEDTPCSPLSMYGIAKNALREALFVEFANKPICFQWLRGFYIYGDDTFNHSIFTKILEAAKSGKKTFPFTSGKNKYDFMSVTQLAEMIAAVILQEKVAGIVNCCSGMPKSLGEVVETFIADNKLDIKLDYGAYPDRPYDSPAIWGDAAKIKMIMENEK